MNNNCQGSDLHILQLTDCHLYADPAGTLLGLNTLDALQRVLSSALSQVAPDLILVTGDLVHDGSKEGYRNLAKTLTQTHRPAAVIPGNHDNALRMQNVLGKQHIPTGGKIDLGNWRLILLNSQVPGQEHGHLSRNELDLLDDALQNAPPNILVCLHHQPVPIGSEWLDNIGLDNGQELLSRIQGNRAVKGIVWGHVHQAWEGELDHMKLIATPSTCIQFSPQMAEFSVNALPPGWRTLTLKANGELLSTVDHLAQMPKGLIADSAGYS
ncbi:3',5'-cyclic-AMP phosphodiesterase [Thiolapillus sp.]